MSRKRPLRRVETQRLGQRQDPITPHPKPTITGKTWVLRYRRHSVPSKKDDLREGFGALQFGDFGGLLG
jgi:hypothetical protein